MKRSRYILTVALVATALCADRGVQAAQGVRPVIASAARGLAQRLTGSLRRTVICVRLTPAARQELRPLVPTGVVSHIAPTVYASGTPFQFRLPPPSL